MHIQIIKCILKNDNGLEKLYPNIGSAKIQLTNDLCICPDENGLKNLTHKNYMMIFRKHQIIQNIQIALFQQQQMMMWTPLIQWSWTCFLQHTVKPISVLIVLKMNLLDICIIQNSLKV